MKKVYVVSGGTSGIGLSLISLLSHDPNNIIYSLSRSLSRIAEAEKTIQNPSGKVIFLQCDVSNTDDVKVSFDIIKKSNKKIDGLINNAGIIKQGGIEQLSFEDWNTSLNVNLSSMYYVTKIFLPLLKDGTASVVNISSISSMLSGASVAYSVAKSGVDMLTKVLARELAKYNIRVNAVNPGITKTGFQVTNKLMDKEVYSDFLEKIESTYPLGLGEPDDIANAINFLLSDSSKWVTGSIFVVDGGRIVNS